MPKKAWYLIAVLIALVACSAPRASPTIGPAPIHTPIRPAGYGENIEGQPEFPDLVENWIVDNGCHFSAETVQIAAETLDALNSDHIAQVAAVCQTGITGGPAEASTWISQWLNHEGLGTLEDKRALAILIRPDVPPGDYRITLNPNDDFYWFTPTDEYDIKREAANYANYDDFDGALESLARNVDAVLRAKWAIYGPTATPTP